MFLEKQYKKIINNNTINLYRGCSHGCIYCDSRSKCYKIDNFEKITVKQDAIKQFRQELKAKKKRCVIHTGSTSDSYCHIEDNLQITKQMLETVYELGFGIRLLTKSSKVLRDLELLKKINKKTFAMVDVTITTFNDELCKKIEPNVSLTSERFETLRILNQNGIPTCVWLCPILPFINDTEENIINIVRKCAEVGTKRIIAFGMGVTMREGNREYFYEQLDKQFLGIKQKYINAFGYSYECSSPNAAKLWEVFIAECKKHGINYEFKDNFNYGLDLVFSSQYSMFN